VGTWTANSVTEFYQAEAEDALHHKDWSQKRFDATGASEVSTFAFKVPATAAADITFRVHDMSMMWVVPVLSYDHFIVWHRCRL